MSVTWNCPCTALYFIFVQKPSIIIRDNVEVTKQYSAIHFLLISSNDLSTFSLIAIKLPDTDI